MVAASTNSPFGGLTGKSSEHLISYKVIHLHKKLGLQKDGFITFIVSNAV